MIITLFMVLRISINSCYTFAAISKGATENARPDIKIVGTDIARLDNAAPDKTVVSLSSSCAYRLLLTLQIKQWC